MTVAGALSPFLRARPHLDREAPDPGEAMGLPEWPGP